MAHIFVRVPKADVEYITLLDARNRRSTTFETTSNTGDTLSGTMYNRTSTGTEDGNLKGTTNKSMLKKICFSKLTYDPFDICDVGILYTYVLNKSGTIRIIADQVDSEAWRI